MGNGMEQYVTTLTKRGQVTLPARVRKLLGAKPKDKITFTVHGDQISLSQAKFTLESAFGSVRPSNRPEDFREISRQVKEDKAERTARRLRPSR
jgi:AbrB family looped-hinge helix DNA binding protein